MDKSIKTRLKAVENKLIYSVTQEQINETMIELAELTKSIELAETVTEQDEKRLKELEKKLSKM